MRKIQSVVLLTLMFVSVFTLAFSTQQVNAEQREVGVEVGDWAKYDVTVNYTTNDPDPPIPAPPLGAREIEYYKVEVESVSGTNITFQVIIRFNNGTETSWRMWTDVASTLGHSFQTFFIAANLSAGDTIYEEPYSPVINATLTRRYAEAERRVNYLVQKNNYTSPYPSFQQVLEMHLYWDRATGILDEWVDEREYTELEQGFVTYMFTGVVIKETNVWEREVGVEVGDWAKYDYVFNYTTNDPALPPPEIPDIEQILIEVLSITSTNITYQLTQCFKNGTETSYVAWTDVSYQIPTFFFKAANLSVGDQLCIGRFSYPINATLKRIYAGAEREVNYIGLMYNSSVTFGLLVNGSMHIYWDRVTGVLDEMSVSQHFTNLTQGYTTNMFMQYVIKETNIWSPTYISAEVNITPKSLNLRSRGRWLRAWIKIPKGYDVKDINIATVKLNGTVKAEFKPRIVGGKWRDSNRGLMVKFERQAVIDLILKDRQSNKFGTVALTITGSLRDGTQFQGSDSIKIIMSMPTRTWRFWRYTAHKHFGSTPLDPNWNPYADLNEDGLIELMDFWIISENKTANKRKIA